MSGWIFGIVGLIGVTVLGIVSLLVLFKIAQAYHAGKGLLEVVQGYLGVILAIITVGAIFAGAYLYLVSQTGIFAGFANGVGLVLETFFANLVEGLANPGITPPTGG